MEQLISNMKIKKFGIPAFILVAYPFYKEIVLNILQSIFAGEHPMKNYIEDNKFV